MRPNNTTTGSKRATKPPPNPFEGRVAKNKWGILGRRTTGGDQNKTVARRKAVEQRKNTLLVEYQSLGKDNEFVDRRIGEFDETMSPEDRMLARFQQERQSRTRKSEMYTLEDGGEMEGLTHLGEAIVDDESDEEGELFVQKEEEKEESGEPRSAREIYKDIIAKSKAARAERAAEKDEWAAKREELDATWDVIRQAATTAAPQSKPKEKDMDDYDQTVRQLQFEIRAKPTDRVKSEEEVAQEQAEHLAELERERVERMRGDEKVDERLEPSADALDDSFVVPDRKEEEEEEGEEEGEDTGTYNLSELPFLLPTPKSIGDLNKLLDGIEVDQHIDVLSRIAKTNHVALGGENKQKIEIFFALLLRRFRTREPFSHELDPLARAICSIAHQVPEFAGKILQEELKSLYSRNWPSLSDCMLFRLLSLVFSVSDKQHAVITPAIICMSHSLVTCQVTSIEDVTIGLFLCGLILETLKSSERFAPEVWAWLTSLLALLSGHEYPAVSGPPTHLSPIGTMSLDISVTPSDCHGDFPVTMESLARDATPCGALSVCLSLVKCNIVDVIGIAPVYAPIESLVAQLKQVQWPDGLNRQITALGKALVKHRHNIDQRRTPLQLYAAAVKPVSIKQRVPAIKTDRTKQRREVTRLRKLVKSETKGAVRALRLDNAFLETQRMTELERRQRDRGERLKQVNQFLQEQQQGANIQSKMAKRKRDAGISHRRKKRA